MLPFLATASAIAAIVTTLTTPSTSSNATAPSTPSSAYAIGSARMPAPTVSVSVSANAVQNGGSVSKRMARRDLSQRSRSRHVTSTAKIDDTGTP